MKRQEGLQCLEEGISRREASSPQPRKAKKRRSGEHRDVRIANRIRAREASPASHVWTYERPPRNDKSFGVELGDSELPAGWGIIITHRGIGNEKIT
jgi:hypothetical protein